MQSKCHLTLVHNDYKKKRSEQELKQNDITAKQQDLSKLLKIISQLEQ